jgi:hypothetical protein
MATSGTIQEAIRTGYRLQIAWTVDSQSVANNTSTVTAKVQLVSTGSSYTINSTASKSGSLTINGTKYTFSFSAALSGNQTKTLYTKTVTVAHSADGSKTCSFSATCGINVTLSGTYYGNVTASGSGTFNTIARASSISSVTSSVSVTGSNSVTVNITRAASSFTHTVVFSFGSYSKTTEDVGTSTSYAIPQSWLNAIPNATSGTAKVTVTTYSGSTKIGSAVSKNFTITVPSTVVPSISAVTLSEATSGIAAQFGGYVQNKSKLAVSVTAAGSYSSTIKSYSVTVQGTPYTKASFTSGVLKNSGTSNVSVTVTDSRGRTASTTKSITVIAYTAPKINTFTTVRANSSGTADDNGTMALAKIKFSVAAVNNKNSKSYKVEYKQKSATTWTQAATGSVYSYDSNMLLNINLSTDKSYDLRLSLTDFFGTVTATSEVATAFTLLDFNSSGKGIAFGKVSEMSEGVEFAMPMHSAHGELPNSPVTLPTNKDLNTLIEPGFYIVPNTSTSATLLNKPPMTGTATALVQVMPMGDATQRLQRYHVCDKDDMLVWQRVYYSGTWGAWMLAGGSSGWKNLTLDSAFALYNGTAANQPQYRINGNLVTVKGCVSPKEAYTSSATKVTIASGIISEVRPDAALSFICQGSGMNRWTLGIETNGTITISRYGVAENISVPTTAWLVFHCTYSI